MNQIGRALWQGEAPLVLASASGVRRALLESVDIPVEVDPADIDERDVERRLGETSADGVALGLAEQKALCVSHRWKDRYVLGADQTLSVGPRRLNKPTGRREAGEHLMLLSGRSHRLHAALALAINGHVLWRHVETATLQMRPLSSAFLHAYLEAAGDAVLHSVGVYRIEGLGMHLFSAIAGDHSTVMGLPLLPLLHQLRNMGLVLE
jgi:septum formation protein